MLLNGLKQVPVPQATTPIYGDELNEPEVKEEEKKTRIRASRIDFTTVNEVYNKFTYQFEIQKPDSHGPDDECDEYIFVHRQRLGESLSMADGGGPTEISFVDIKSTRLRDVLQEILEGLTCISLREDKPSINSDILFAYLSELEDFHQKAEKPYTEGIVHLDKLVEFLRIHYATTDEKLTALLQHNEITFDLLPVFFQPNSILYMDCPTSGKPRCLRFDSGKMNKRQSRTCFELACRCFAHDGRSSGEAKVTLLISEFQGVIKINSLSVYPLRYHSAEETIITELTERGRKFVRLTGMHYYTYTGMGYFRLSKDRTITFPSNGRTMIDALSFKENNARYAFEHAKESLDTDFEHFSLSGDTSSEGNLVITKTSYNDQEYLLCNPTVYGFNVENKQWAEFDVSALKDVHWNISAYDKIEIPKKDIIWSLVYNYSPDGKLHYTAQNKGARLSLVFLLHGPPGVGKTATAEAISETMKMPLYVVCAGDLGNDALQLEQNLRNIISLAERWNAIILIDEADVYLEERTVQDIRRNGLVSVFLRYLENFSGILFLTTNRVTAFDNAFWSRIHLSVKFNHLDNGTRLKIWNNLLEAEDLTKSSNFDDTEIETLSRADINGRQIRNCIQTGLILANSRGEPLSVKHLNIFIQAASIFDTSREEHMYT